jgi:serine/threonine-protein kinase HipA
MRLSVTAGHLMMTHDRCIPLPMTRLPMSLDPKTITALAVRIHGRPIGVINRIAGDSYIFAFEDDYLDDLERPVVSLSFKGPRGTIVAPARTYPTRLPPFFSNLLPEGPLRGYLAAQAGVKPERDFFLLAALGVDLPGAITVAPFDGHGAAATSESATYGAGDTTAKSVLRFSLAGVQLKFSAIAEATGGLTIPADGIGGSWIVKLPSTEFPAVPENEFAMLELARAIGIDVPDIKLIPIDQISGLPHDVGRLEGQALCVKRFDRSDDGARIHMEDFAQVFGLFPDDKYRKRSYANIASVLNAETGDAGTTDFVRRLVFSVLIGNGDMHLKNWSLLYPDGHTPVLSPAYDFVSTVPYIPDDTLGLTFGRSRSLTSITRDQVRRFADTAGLAASPIWETVRETVSRTVNAWKTLDAADVLPTELRKQIDTQIDTAARFRWGQG